MLAVEGWNGWHRTDVAIRKDHDMAVGDNRVGCKVLERDVDHGT